MRHLLYLTFSLAILVVVGCPMSGGTSSRYPESSQQAVEPTADPIEPHGQQAANQPGKLKISRFQVNTDDKRATVSDSLPSVISGIVSVGGGYGDVISILRMAKAKGYLTEQLAVDPLPAAIRVYHRDEETELTTNDLSSDNSIDTDDEDNSSAISTESASKSTDNE